jgi:hypothetical protein
MMGVAKTAAFHEAGKPPGALLQQYLTLFKLSADSRCLGHRSPGFGAVYRARRQELNLLNQYQDDY